MGGSPWNSPQSGHRRTGVAREILQRILTEARARAYLRLSLETGSQAEFLPARRLYESYGFAYCGPFSDYVEDPHSVFMTLQLREEGDRGDEA
jgi:putative acetyltransferase